MKYCEKCHVDVEGKRSLCPLCQSPLQEGTGDSEEAFVFIPTIYRQHSLFFRIFIFISVCAAVISVAVNLMLPKSGIWSLFVVVGVGCMWLSISFSIHLRRNLFRNLMYQVAAVLVLSVLWDIFTGWHGWSLDYVVPCTCMLALVALAILSCVMHLEVREYLIYVCIACVLGILPLIVFFFGMLRITIPSLVCVALSIITLVSLFLFHGEHMVSELRRRLHL